MLFPEELQVSSYEPEKQGKEQEKNWLKWSYARLFTLEDDLISKTKHISIMPPTIIASSNNNAL